MASLGEYLHGGVGSNEHAAWHAFDRSLRQNFVGSKHELSSKEVTRIGPHLCGRQQKIVLGRLLSPRCSKLPYR